MYKSTTSEKPTVTWLKLSFTIYILFPIFISCLLLAMLGKLQIKCLQPPPSEADTFGASTILCLSYRNVHLIESQLKGVKKGRHKV